MARINFVHENVRLVCVSENLTSESRYTHVNAPTSPNQNIVSRMERHEFQPPMYSQKKYSWNLMLIVSRCADQRYSYQIVDTLICIPRAELELHRVVVVER